MVRNFLFHRVNPERDKLWDPMDVALFERCIQYISKKYTVVLIEDIAFSDERFTKNKYATIMFDDGYKDNIQYAAPILKKYNCKASFYVVTDCIDNNIPTWTHVLDYSFQHTNVSEIDLSFDFLPDEFKVNNIPTAEKRIAYGSRLKPYLKKITHEKRGLVLDQIARSYNDIKVPELMMNWDDIKELSAAGHYIGSHTVTHCMLGTMSDETEIKHELLNSANRIQEKLGYFPLTISYPIGSYNDTTKRLSKELGYKIGLAVNQNIYDPAIEDLFEISRIELYNEPWWKTRLRISNALENIKSLIKYK
ncbi:polysaccharide deacetylase family protein [Ferruginibacter lapsinanis]|uniref:polysaccharide deacetylase family protein n=1 Tax=Ferruginibacter lapsinanis TaxID=563172 RepID=UPI001E2BC811|nr:polysaccharide deacetylase family protein [Ferruginibacter lapsinanis]UEG50559.1 polysaccharide deacetylase family protein [Ferruginibacter lapsinanis]